MKLTKEKIDLLLNGSREERIYACARSFKLFAIFHFTKYFAYPLAPYHDDFFNDFEDLVYGTVKEAVWIAFRESAKTSLAKDRPHVDHRTQASDRCPAEARRRRELLGRALTQAERREHPFRRGNRATDQQPFDQRFLAALQPTAHER